MMKATPAVLLLIVCSACTDPDAVVVEMANATLQVPLDQEFSKIHTSDQGVKYRSVSFEICDQHVTRLPKAQCELHGEFGTWTLLREPAAGSEFNRLKERPSSVERPPDAELIPLRSGDVGEVRFGTPQAAEGMALSRVRSKVYGDEPQLSTTDRGWPIADCDQHSTGAIACRFGFLMTGTPVVAQWFSPSGQNSITQAEVWDVATDIDRRLRQMVVSSATKRS